MDREKLANRIKTTIREVPNFPVEGINFKDTTPLLRDSELFQDILNYIGKRYSDKDIDYVVGKDMQPLLWTGAVARTLKTGVVPIFRKDLYGNKICKKYKHEYRERTLYLQKEALKPSDKVLIVDYIIATGNTAKNIAEMVKELGAQVEEIFSVMELEYLEGRKKLSKCPKTRDCRIHSIARFAN